MRAMSMLASSDGSPRTAAAVDPFVAGLPLIPAPLGSWLGVSLLTADMTQASQHQHAGGRCIEPGCRRAADCIAKHAEHRAPLWRDSDAIDCY